MIKFVQCRTVDSAALKPAFNNHQLNNMKIHIKSTSEYCTNTNVYAAEHQLQSQQLF